jgi:hypothetical protein
MGEYLLVTEGEQSSGMLAMPFRCGCSRPIQFGRLLTDAQACKEFFEEVPSRDPSEPRP